MPITTAADNKLLFYLHFSDKERIPADFLKLEASSKSYFWSKIIYRERKKRKIKIKVKLHLEIQWSINTPIGGQYHGDSLFSQLHIYQLESLKCYLYIRSFLANLRSSMKHSYLWYGCAYRNLWIFGIPVVQVCRPAFQNIPFINLASWKKTTKKKNVHILGCMKCWPILPFYFTTLSYTICCFIFHLVWLNYPFIHIPMIILLERGGQILIWQRWKEYSNLGCTTQVGIYTPATHPLHTQR